jgi:hypothetical protein
VIHEYPHSTIEYRDDGIVLVRINDNVHITAADVQNLHLQIAEITAGKICPMLFEYGEFNTFSDEALTLFANETPSKADAFVLNESFLLTAFANHYLELTHPQRPTKLFYDAAEAIAWLKKFVS